MPDGDAQRCGQPGQIVDRDIARPALDVTEIGTIDTALKSQCFLAEFSVGAQEPHIAGEDVTSLVGMIAFHTGNQPVCRL